MGIQEVIIKNNELTSEWLFDTEIIENIIWILEILINETTCSSDAYLRGAGQKVVSYSFYGDIGTSESKKKGNSAGWKVDLMYCHWFAIIS